jgi:hypothetical protein
MSDSKNQPAAAAGAAATNPDGTPRQQQPNRRLQATQAQVDEVVDIMRVNVEKVLERDQKLTALDDRADALQFGASQFEKSAGALKSKYACQNMKMTIIMCVSFGLFVLGVGYYYYNSMQQAAQFMGGGGGGQVNNYVPQQMPPQQQQQQPQSFITQAIQQQQVHH